MTDADLLRLLQEKLPGDFTDQELSALRARWKDSSEIRDAVAALLELETELATGLADVSLSIDDLLAKAASRQQAARIRRPQWWLAIGLTAGALLVVGVSAWWSQQNRPEPTERVAVHAPQNDGPQPETPAHPATKTDATAPDDPVKSAEAALAATMPNEPLTPASPTVPLPVEGPWTPWINGELAPLAMENPQWRADLRSMGHDEIPLAEFQRWWGEVPGMAAGWNEAIIGGKRTVQIDGRMQLKAPWVDDAVLRLTPFDLTDLTLLFGNQERGVALRFYRQREPHQWAAYEFQRLPGETAIKWGGLLSTDGGAWYRSGAATFEVRRQDGQLILSAGKIPILTVPLTEAPTVVQLFGRGRLRGFTWQRAEPWPIAQQTLHPNIMTNGDGDAIVWHSVKPETAMVHAEASGAVTLTGGSKTEDAFAFTRIPQSTLVETIVRFSAADAGTGVYLGNEAGKPLALLGVFHDKRSNQLAFGPLRPGDRRVDTEFDPNAFPPPYWSPNVWLRVVAGLGMCHVWSSGDGVHWGHIAENPLPDVVGPVRTLGLYGFPGDTPRTIRLDSYQVRELTGVTRFGNEPGLRQPATLPEPLPSSYAEWQAAVIDQLPDDASPTSWMTRAAVNTLKAGPSRSLGREIVERLTESESFRRSDEAQQRDFLDDAVSLLETLHEPALTPFRRGYFQRSRQSPAAAETAWAHWLQSPVWTTQANPSLQREAITDHLLAGAFGSVRESLPTVTADAQFWLNLPHPDHRLRPEGEMVERLARWSRSATGLGDQPGDAAEVLPLGWRHPWQLTVNKEAYNVRSELRSALIGGNFGDAGRIAMNFGTNDGVGLLPDMDDDRLFVSIPVAMATAVKDYPAFGEALRNDLGPTGLVRVAQAARRGDLSTLRAATIQFYGTDAAAEAERVLGDRQMALGDFFAARRHYLHAQRSASDEQRRALQIRSLLAESLLGTRSKLPESDELSALKLDGVALAPLLQEVISPTPASPEAVVPPATVVRQSSYRVDIKGRFDGQVGQNAGRGEFRHVDAFGRQFAVTVDAQRFYVSNRFQVTAYHRDNAQQLWAASVGSDQGEAHAHRFAAMSPMIVQGKLLVRRLTKAGIELACLKPEDGQELWKTRAGDKAAILSEPLALPGRIGVLVGHRGEEETLDVRWTQLSPATGDVMAEFPLVRLRDAWNGEVPCTLSMKDDRAVAIVGGVVIGFETTGTLHWVRRETWLPPKIDPQWHDYLVSAPVFSATSAGDPVVLAASPSSREVHGIDFATGRVRWTRFLPALQGVLAAQDPLAVLAETDRLTGLAVETGNVVWTRPLTGRMTGTRIDGDQLVMAIQRDSTNNKAWPQLAWFDLATGKPHGEAQLELEDQSDWDVGPFFTIGDAWWTLIGRPGNKPQRDLALLVPTRDHSPQPWADSAWDGWISVLPNERRMVQSLLPGWQPLVTGRNVFTAPNESIRDQRQVLVAKLTRANEHIRFVRTVKVPDQGTPGLHLRVGHQPGQRWQLELRVGGRTILSEPVTDESAPNGWLDTHVSLFPFAGQAVTLQILQKNLDTKPVEALWREARLTGFAEP